MPRPTRRSTRRLAWLGGCGAILLAGCTDQGPSVINFIGMSQQQRQATWNELSPVEKRVLNCKLEAWVAYTNARSNLSASGSGPREWGGSNTAWIDHATGNPPEVAACNAIRDQQAAK